MKVYLIPLAPNPGVSELLDDFQLSELAQSSDLQVSKVHTAQINTTSPLGLQEGSFKPEDEKAIDSISPYEVDTAETSSSNLGNSSSASCGHDISFTNAPQELPIDTGSEKVRPKDKEPRDSEPKDMKAHVEDLEDDHENNLVDSFWVDEITAALTPNPSVKIYANDASSRDAAMSTSNNFDMAILSGFQQRKPVVTISNSNGSSAVSELADVQYTGSVDVDTEALSAPLPSSVATDSQSKSNDMTARVQ